MDNKKQIALKRIPIYVGGAVTAAVIPIPIADTVAITSLQVAMLFDIIHVIYGKKLGLKTLKGLAYVAMAQTAGLMVWSLVKVVPILGTAAGIAGQMVIAGTITAALGLAIIDLLDQGKDLTPDNIKAGMKEKKSEAEKMAKEETEKRKKNIDDIKSIGFKCKTPEVTDKLVLKFNAAKHSNTKIEIKDMDNNTFQTTDVEGDGQKIEIPMDGFEKGSYCAVFKADEIEDIYIFFVKL